MNKAEKITAILAITQVFKYYGAPSALLPIVAMGIGAMFQYIENPTSNGIMEGVIFGAVVTGSFSLIKGIFKSVFGLRKKDLTSDLEADDDRGV
jgi:hypothetical protein